jgi:hypothetical protein
MVVTTRDGILDSIFVNTDSTSKGLFLPDILQRYGAPSAALLRTFHDRGPFGLPFILALVYEDNRFIALYELEGERFGEDVVGCPSSTPPQITIWGPEKIWTPESIQTYLLGIDYTQPLLPLEDSSEFTVDSLYEASQQQGQALCIRTPASLW